MRRLKQILSILLLCCLVLTMLPMSALAADTEQSQDNSTDSEAEKTINFTSTVAVDGDITRAAWISRLVETFNMTVTDDSDMPDNYFSDLTEDMECYQDILLAVEFGIIDLEAGEALQPDESATREFAAQTLNACCKFQLDTTDYTFEEYETVTYPDDIQVAINRGWFALSGKKFLPEQAITEEEATAMLEDAKAVISGPEDLETEGYTFANDVVIVPDSTAVKVDDEVVTIQQCPVTIQQDQFFVVYVQGYPIVRKAVSVDTQEDVTTIVTSTEGIENAITGGGVSSSFEPDMEQFVPAEATSYTVTNATTYESTTMSIRPYSIKYDKNTKTLSVNHSISIGSATAGSVSIKLSNLKLDYKDSLSQQYVSVELTGDWNVSTSISFDMGDYLGVPNQIPLGTFDVLGVGKISVGINCKLGGGLTASWSGDMLGGIEYSAANGLRLKSKFQREGFHFVAETVIDFCPFISCGVDLLLLNGSITLSAGVKMFTTYDVYEDGQLPETCLHCQGHLYAWLDTNVTVGIGVWKKTLYSQPYVIYDENNSPGRVSYHYEDGKWVPKCTREGQSSDKHWTYYTSSSSSYFSPGPSYGQSSYGDAGEGETTIAPFEYELIEPENPSTAIRITKCNLTSSAIAIPSTIDGYTVTEIGDKVFESKTALCAVTMPDTITVIGGAAFAKCNNLSSVMLSKNLTDLGAYAFTECSSLKEIEIPKSLNNISSFYYNGWRYGPFDDSGLTSVTFEAGTTMVAGNLFMNAKELETVGWIDTITSIENLAFCGCVSLKSIELPDNISKIGGGAFAKCTNLSLSNVKLPKNLLELGACAFTECSSLKEIEIPKSLNNISSFFDGSWRYGPFEESGLTSVTFEAGTTMVVGNLFMNAKELETVGWIDTITSIENLAFCGCVSLKSIELPDNISKIGGGAFAKCTNLSLSNVKLPKNLLELGACAFTECSSLKEIEIPKSLNNISSFFDGSWRYGPFEESGLTSVTFETGTTKVITNLFIGAQDLKSVTLLDTMTSIGEYAFDGCAALPSIEIPNSITSIGKYAFQGCSSLLEVKIPDGVTVLNNYTFNGCTSLATVSLPEELTSMGNGVFYQCAALESISLPETLTQMGEAVFAETGLCEITIPAACTKVLKQAFQKCANLSKVILSEGIQQIENEQAFEDCDSLKEVSLPKSLISIGNYAFHDCDTLEKITIPDNVETLGDGIFESCDMLASVDLGNGITSIPVYAFKDCPALPSITLPYRVTSIKTEAFKNDTALTSVTIPRSVTAIDTSAFSYPDKTVIYGVPGTYAQTFANENGYTFVGQEIAATAVSLDVAELSVARGKTAKLTLAIEPENFTDAVSWKSSNENVATITDAGTVTAKEVGTATIKVTVGSKSASCKVTVFQPVTNIWLNKDNLTLEALTTYQLTANVWPDDAVNREVTWSSSAAEIASVDETGLVTTLKKGTADITVAALDGSGVTAVCHVTVSNNAYIATSEKELESPHPYENSCSDIWKLTVSDATYIEVTFDARTNIEDGFDWLYVYGANDQPDDSHKYTGTTLAGQKIRVSGNTLYIKMASDSGGSEWGFKVTDIDTDGTLGPVEDGLRTAVFSGTQASVRVYCSQGPFQLVCAYFKDNGQMVSVQTKQINTSEVWQTATFSDAPSNAAYARFFLLKEKTMAPLCEPKTANRVDT